MSRNGRHSEDKVALVLAGGGMTGAVYEIGALRAIDDLLVDRSVNDFDIFVGTSAGSIVASFIANGVSPADMFRAIAGEHPDLPALRREHIFSFNYREFLRRGIALPPRLAVAVAEYFLSRGNSTLVDTLWNLTDVLPSGLYDGRALERYIRESLAAANGSNDFDALERELYIVATDLASGARAVFGPQDQQAAAVSQAVAASSALPIVYKPVNIGGREYVDGGLGGTASLDIAIEHGATLVVCVNPLVPFDDRRVPAPAAGHQTFTERGLSAIASQISRITVHSGLKYHVKQLRRQHPEVDIILVEPRADDQMLAFGNIMRYGERLAIARHGFEAVTLDLAQEHGTYKDILARHGIPLSRRLVIEELQEIVNSGNDPEVIERILEKRKPRCDEQNRDSLFCRLSESLNQLERELETRSLDAA